MRRAQTDILISGGGVAGLAAAAAFGAQGFDVVCVEPAPPVTDAAADGADLRTTAFLQPAVATLTAAGLWDRLSPYGAPLQIMRIVDAGGADPEPRMIRDFDAADISDQPFGWNLPNWLLRREMVARLAEMPNVSFRPGTGFASLLARETEAIVTLTDGTSLGARLVIAADGRASPVREALGIGVRTTRYGQKALAFTVTHDQPHLNVSTEVHRSGGPFTLVPLPDREGKPASAVVWMEAGPRNHAPRRPAGGRVRNRDDRPLSRGARRPQPCLAPDDLADHQPDRRPDVRTPHRRCWPRPRMSCPPSARKGLNMSLADLACLLDLATTRHRDDLGCHPHDSTASTAAATGKCRPGLTGIDASEPRLDGQCTNAARPARQGAGHPLRHHTAAPHADESRARPALKQHLGPVPESV